MPSEVPALGHDVSTDYRTHSVDLSAQKLILSAPRPDVHVTLRTCTSLAHGALHSAIARSASNVGVTHGTVNHRRCHVATRHVWHRVVCTGAVHADAARRRWVREGKGTRAIADTGEHPIARTHGMRTIHISTLALTMDIGLVAALVMLVVWAIATFVYEGPGWIHLLLSAGMFLLFWRISAMTAGVRARHAADDDETAERPD
jgi:hypothetical protein